MAKILLNLHQGLIEIEGDEAFVREAFKDVRAAISPLTLSSPQVVDGSGEPTSEPETPEHNPLPPTTKAKAKPKPKPKSTTSKGSGQGINKYYQGTFDPNIDFSGLPAFTAKYAPSNNMARNLVYAAFFRDHLGNSPCTADDIFGCYYSMKSDVKLPEAFGKSLTDARSEGFISFTEPGAISIPTVGENKLTEMAKKVSGGD